MSPLSWPALLLQVELSNSSEKLLRFPSLLMYPNLPWITASFYPFLLISTSTFFKLFFQALVFILSVRLTSTLFSILFEVEFNFSLQPYQNYPKSLTGTRMDLNSEFVVNRWLNRSNKLWCRREHTVKGVSGLNLGAWSNSKWVAFCVFR